MLQKWVPNIPEDNKAGVWIPREILPQSQGSGQTAFGRSSSSVIHICGIQLNATDICVDINAICKFIFAGAGYWQGSAFLLYKNISVSYLFLYFWLSHWTLPSGLAVKRWEGTNLWRSIPSSTLSLGVTYTYRHLQSLPPTCQPCLRMMRTATET